MKKVTKRLACATLIGAMLLAISACEKQPKTVDYFKQHPKEIQPTLDDCKNRMINITADNVEARNCRAAGLAKAKDYLKDLKP